MNRNTEGQPAKDFPIACLLTHENRKLRRDSIVQPLFSRMQEVRSLADGYAVRFPGDDETAALLVHFITGERACCPFFTFELVFEPWNGPIWLRLRGPEGAKALVGTLLDEVAPLP